MDHFTERRETVTIIEAVSHLYKYCKFSQQVLQAHVTLREY